MNYFNTQMGFGTANLGNSRDPDLWRSDKSAMRYAIDIGYKVFDTAEMYGDGKSETMLGEALRESGKRDQVHIVTKVLPDNATTYEGIIKACQDSIKRLDCDFIDTYLLHWRRPDDLDLQPIIEAFLYLKSSGLIKNYGVSNFRKRWIEEWQTIENRLKVPSTIVTNQVHYSVNHRDVEKYYMDWQAENNITTMAYSPLNNERNQLLTNPQYQKIAQEHGYDLAQLAIAWCIRRPDVTVIPMSSKPTNILNNFRAASIKLTPDVLLALGKEFPIIYD